MAARITLGAFLTVLAGVAIYLIYSQSSGQAEGPRGGFGAREVPVMVAPVTETKFFDVLEALGTAKANESVSITAKVTETVRRIHFSDGMNVEDGDILVELTSAEESAQIEEARAALQEADQQLERVKDLVSKGNAPQSRLDSQRALRDGANARVVGLEARLADRLIRAPFEGLLGLRMVSPGTLVQPGSQITTLDDISLIKVDFTIPESFLAALGVGQSIVAQSAAYPDRDFEGRVTTLDTRVDPVTRAVIVRAEIPNEDGAIRPGMLLTVDLVNNERVQLSVPEEALVPIQDRKYVFVLKEDKTVEQRLITIGSRIPGTVEIVDGLEKGDQVVTLGTNRVRDGSKVKVLEEKPAQLPASSMMDQSIGASRKAG